MKQLALTPLIALVLAASGCGTLFNKNPQHITLRSGVTVDGNSGDIELDQKESHVVTYADGRTCTLEPGISIGYFVLDLFTTGPLGIIVDAVTGGWKVLKGCDDIE